MVLKGSITATSTLQDSEPFPLVSASPFKLLALLGIFSYGSVLPAEPCSEEREGRASKTAVGGSQRSHLDPVVFLLLWVSSIVDYGRAAECIF